MFVLNFWFHGIITLERFSSIFFLLTPPIGDPSTQPSKLIYFFILSYSNLEAYWRQLSLVGQSTMVTCTLLEADICRFHVELVTFYILWRMRRTEKDIVVPEMIVYLEGCSIKYRGNS